MNKGPSDFVQGLFCGVVGAWILFVPLFTLILSPADTERGKNIVREEARQIGLGEWVTSVEVAKQGTKWTTSNWKWKTDCGKAKQ
jgi:hypothetical protein